MVDEIRRVLMESVIPWLMQHKGDVKSVVEAKLSHKTSISESGKRSIEEAIIAAELAELQRDELEMFDDYLEFVMTYGYITMFAAAFPLGTAVTALFIYLELKSDVFKLERTLRRPKV